MGLSRLLDFQNVQMSVLFTIFPGVSFEIILRTCEYLKKKIELWENTSSDSPTSEDSFPRSLTFGRRSWSVSCSSLEEKVEKFSETITSAPTSEETGVRTFSSDECEYQESHFSENPSTSVGTSPSLSLFHSEEKNIYISHTKDPISEWQTIQFSSKNLFSIMKTNKKKKTGFSDDLRFQKAFKFTARDKDLNVTPCPLVHLFFSSDQIKLMEENVKSKILSKSKATLGRDANYPCLRSQEPLTQNQLADEMVIPAQVQDSFPEENAMQNQRFHEAQFTSQTQQHIHYQESVGSLPDFTQPPDLEAQFPSQTQQCIYNEKSVIGQPDFPEPPDLMRTPFSRSIQDSFQAEGVDESQHFIKVPLFETQDLIKGVEVDDHFSETQYCIYSEESNNVKYPIEGQNSVVKNAEFLASSLNSDSFAEDKPQQKSIMPQIQQPISSSELNQYSTNSSTSLSPIIKEQRNRRKIPEHERKLSLKVSSLKAKKTSNLQVILMTVCHTSNDKTEIRYKKKKLPQKKMPDTALYLTSSVSKLSTPHIKKYFMKNLVTVMTDLIKYEYFLQKQTRSPDTEEICYGISTEGETSRSVENVEQSFMVNTDELETPCSLFERNEESKESSKDSVKQTFDLNVPKYEMLSEEVISESMQKCISSPQIESSQGMKIQMDLPNAENVEELIISTANTQRYSSKENTGNANDPVEIILKFSGINLLISLAPKKHERNELKSMKVQVKRGSIEEEKPLIPDIAEYSNPSESEKLDCNKKDMHRDKGTSDIFHNVMPTSISEPLDIDMQSELKTKTGTSTVTSYSNSALKQEKSGDLQRMDSFHDADTKRSIRMETGFQRSAELEMGPLMSERLPVGDSLNQRESDVPSNKNETRKILYGSTLKRKLSKDLSVAFSRTFNYCVPISICSKKKKDRVKFTNMNTMRFKCTNKVKPPVSKTLNIAGNRKKSKLNSKNTFKKKSHAKAFSGECQNSLSSLLRSRFHQTVTGPLKNYLVPLKPLLPLQFRKVPFAEMFNSDAFCSTIELKHLPQMKKIRSSIVDVKDTMGLRHFCEIDHDLQCKYLRSVSKSPVDMFPKPNVLPNHIPILSPCSVHKKVDDGKEDHTHSFDKEPLQNVACKNENPDENILLSRKFQEPTLMPAFDPDLQGMDQKDSRVLSDLRSHMTPEKYRQCCIWFQEINSHKYSASRTQENATDLADSHSSWISNDWTDIPLHTEGSTNLEEHQAPEKSDSEESVFIETNFYLTLDSQKSLSKVPKGIPLADLKVEEASCFTPLYSKDPSVHHSKTHGKQTSSVIPPSCKSQKRRKYRSSSQTQPPDWLSHSSSSTMEIRSTSPSKLFYKRKYSGTTGNKARCPSTTTTESKITVCHSKDHGKSPMHPEVRERRKATSNSHRKYSVHWSTEYGHSHSEEKHVKKKKVYNYQPKRSDYIQSDHSPASKAPQESINFSSERREYQPFFYACVPADSMDTVPKTIRWVIPPKILQKRNFQVPRVVNISKSCSSKKTSLAEVFHKLRQG